MLSQLTARLDEWEKRLEAHFELLATSRRDVGHAVFAIEHGLEATDLEGLASDLRTWLTLDEGLSRYWLLWVVYATELGYDYDGLEYWSSFEQRTPRWRIDASRRQQLRRFFERFQKKYEGFQPSGPWAGQFSIIAWPITHAFLPKDLQEQLARVLYEQRYLVAGFLDAPPKEMGRVLRATAQGSSRLTIFLEQEELAGRIVLALLGHNDGTAGQTIASLTLTRILTDLESTRDAKSWLHEARKAAESVAIRLATRSRLPNGTNDLVVERTEQSRHAESRSVRPVLALSCYAKDSWLVSLEIPSFSGIATLGTHYASFLKANRCSIPSAGQSWYPKGWLLCGSQRKKLVEWPDPAQPVLRFEHWDAAIHHIIQNECRINAGPRWLFKINSDGTAAEVATHRVRPGHRYLLLCRVDDSEIHQAPVLRPVGLDCKGVRAFELGLSENASEEVLRSVAAIGLTVERSLRIWPAGLPAARWDGEGQGEWFVDDHITLAVSHSGACEELAVQGNGCQLKVACTPGEATFLSVGKMPEGIHTVVVSATYRSLRDASGMRHTGAQTSFTIVVRPRRRWSPGVSGHNGLVVSTLPHDPSLDGLLDGKVSVFIAGPEGRKVECYVLLSSGSGSPIGRVEFGTLTLPSTNLDWQTLLQSKDSKAFDPDVLLRASGATLVIDGDELGSAVTPLSHAASPIRWLARGTKQIELQLVNDTDRVVPVAVQFASYRHATCLEPADIDCENWNVASSGGLYFATDGIDDAGIVVSPPGKMTSFGQLAERPDLGKPLTNGSEVIALLSCMSKWSKARIVGPLAAQRRAVALQAMEDQLVTTMCWPQWLKTEHRFSSSQESDRELILENFFGTDYLTYAISLSKTHRDVISPFAEGSRLALLGPSIRFHVCGDELLCEAALRLSATPATFLTWANGRALHLLDDLAKVPILVRGARLATLLGQDTARRNAEGWPA